MSDNNRSIILVLLFSVIPYIGVAQITPEGRFLTDSIKVGEEVLYSLSIRYPTDMDIVFPDSLYDFSPFEINRKDYFFTESDSISSFDSAVYNLSTFEVDSVQYLRLPVFLIRDSDSVAMYPAMDSVVLAHIVTQIPDSVSFIANTVHKDVPLDFNYPYLVAGLIILAIVVLLVIIFFGGKIRRAIILYRLKKSHNRFVNNYQDSLSSQDLNTEHVLYLWKKYMEKLEKYPYTKSTTKEIVGMQGNQEILKPLKSIDRAIYGRINEKGLKDKFYDLLSFSDRKYQLIVEKIKYGVGNPE